jgi:TonB family protein
MRRAGIFAAAALLATLSARTGTAQAPVHPERRVVYKVAAVYPELAKRDHIRGVVRLEIVVGANGTVTSTKPLGGAPVLIPSAIDAVRKWRFEAASKETTEIVQVIFALPQS